VGTTAPELSQLITDYLVSSHPRWSPQTVRLYTADFSTYLDWLRTEQRAETPDALRDHIYGGNQYASLTRTRKRSVLRGLYRWAAERELRPRSFLGAFEGVVDFWQQHQPGPSLEIVDAIFASIPDTRRRDRVLFRLMITSGLTVGDVQFLLVSGVRQVEGGYRIDRARPHPSRPLWVSDPATVQDLAAYLASFTEQDSLLFPPRWNGNGRPIGQRTIHALWQRYAKPHGVTGSPQQLRGYYLTQRKLGRPVWTADPAVPDSLENSTEAS
jgi:site-specific recombinase XerD